MNQVLAEIATLDKVHEEGASHGISYESHVADVIGGMATRDLTEETILSGVSASNERSQKSLGNKELLDDQTWNRITKKIEGQYDGIDSEMSERILDQTLGFLSLISKDKEHMYSPSQLVDKGWHTFILYTKEYSDFCDNIAGQYIHHSPNDDPSTDYDKIERGDPVEAMKTLGIPVDQPLWETQSNGCDGHSTCDSPLG